MTAVRRNLSWTREHYLCLSAPSYSIVKVEVIWKNKSRVSIIVSYLLVNIGGLSLTSVMIIVTLAVVVLLVSTLVAISFKIYNFVVS